MIETLRSRLAAILLLVALLFTLSVWFGSLAPAPDLGNYPSQEQLAGDYDQYLGEHVTVSGTVQSTAPVVIAASYGADDTIELQITDLKIKVERGEKLRVYGIARPDRRIQSLNAFTVPSRGLWYTWSISFLAGLWVLGRIVRHWRLTLNIDFEPRSHPYTFVRREDDTDA